MAGEGAKRRVLIVEDDPDVARFVELNLGLAGWDVSVIGDGDAVMSQAEEFLPDVVVLDVMLPNVDGFRIAECLRANPPTAKAGIVFLTARGQTQDRVTGLTIGDEYVVKPFDPEELVIRIEKVWQRVRRR